MTEMTFDWNDIDNIERDTNGLFKNGLMVIHQDNIIIYSDINDFLEDYPKYTFDFKVVNQNGNKHLICNWIDPIMIKTYKSSGLDILDKYLKPFEIRSLNENGFKSVVSMDYSDYKYEKLKYLTDNQYSEYPADLENLIVCPFVED